LFSILSLRFSDTWAFAERKTLRGAQISVTDSEMGMRPVIS